MPASPATKADGTSVRSDSLIQNGLTTTNGTTLYTTTTNGNTESYTSLSFIQEDSSNHHQLVSFRITALDILEQRVVRETSDEDVALILAQLRKSLELKNNLDAPFYVID